MGSVLIDNIDGVSLLEITLDWHLLQSMVFVH